jgi:Uma2 family endonuclease
MSLEAATLPPVIPRRLPRLPAREQSWPAQGEWTYEDYSRLPDDGQRYEIIEGVLYVTAAPSFDHQFTVTQLAVHLDNHVTQHQLGIVLVAPFEVHLPGIARPVQPDVLFIAAERAPQPGAANLTGAPDLIVEVLSPSTARTDRVVKFGAYERAAVREYWLVDPRTRSVEVYSLSQDGTYEMTGQHTPGESVASAVLDDLAVPVGDLFVVKA